MAATISCLITTWLAWLPPWYAAVMYSYFCTSPTLHSPWTYMYLLCYPQVVQMCSFWFFLLWIFLYIIFWFSGTNEFFSIHSLVAIRNTTLELFISIIADSTPFGYIGVERDNNQLFGGFDTKNVFPYSEWYPILFI